MKADLNGDGEVTLEEWLKYGEQRVPSLYDDAKALVLLMRWSGLAIKDSVTLERSRISADGSVFLYRAKTGVPVYVPLPPHVHQLIECLKSICANECHYGIHSEKNTLKS